MRFPSLKGDESFGTPGVSRSWVLLDFRIGILPLSTHGRGFATTTSPQTTKYSDKGVMAQSSHSPTLCRYRIVVRLVWNHLVDRHTSCPKIDPYPTPVTMTGAHPSSFPVYRNKLQWEVGNPSLERFWYHLIEVSTIFGVHHSSLQSHSFTTEFEL